VSDREFIIICPDFNIDLLPVISSEEALRRLKHLQLNGKILKCPSSRHREWGRKDYTTNPEMNPWSWREGIHEHENIAPEEYRIDSE
jgi:hypothetical protein